MATQSICIPLSKLYIFHSQFNKNSTNLIVVGNMKYSQFMNCYKEICLQVLSTLILPVDVHQGGLFSMRTLPAGLSNRPV